MASISRMTIPAVMACLVLGTACSESSAGPPPLPSCGAHGTQLALAVGAYTSIDPATDSGCVTFAANTAPDTAEYLVLPWSGGGATGSTASFVLMAAETVTSCARAGGARPAAASRAGRRKRATVVRAELTRRSPRPAASGPTPRTPPGSRRRWARPTVGPAAAPMVVPSVDPSRGRRPSTARPGARRPASRAFGPKPTKSVACRRGPVIGAPARSARRSPGRPRRSRPCPPGRA